MVKQLPHNIDAEQGVLGSLFLHNDSVYKILDIIKAKDFYDLKNALIFESVLELVKKSSTIDFVTVSDKLKSINKLDDIGGLEYLSQLADKVPSASNIIEYATIVKTKSWLRKLINAGQNITGFGYQEEKELGEVLNKSEKEIFKVSENFIKSNFVHISDIVESVYKNIETIHNQDEKNRLRWLKTGLTDLDNLLSGLQNSDMIVLAGRPSMGKTTVALNLTQNIAIDEKKSVGFFSLEMSKEQLVERLFCNVMGVNSHSFRTGQLTENEMSKLGETMDKLKEAKIFIDDSAEMSILDIHTKARRLKMEKWLDFLVIDYLQLIGGSSKGGSFNRVNEISEISRGVKIIAKELNIPVLILSQLNRWVEVRPNKEPVLSDLRESGSIEQDADVVIMIYRDEVYDEESEKKWILDLIIRKHRNGPIGKVATFFDINAGKIMNLDNRIE